MNNDIRKLVDDNWDEIKELIAQKVEAEQKYKTIWDFNTNDRNSYYYIDEAGYIRADWFDEDYFKIRRDLGNAFLTEKEAEFERERRKIEAIIRKYSKPFESGKFNYVLIYNHRSKTTIVECYRFIDCSIPCFESEEMAQKVINEIGKNRLKKYWFGVK